MLEHIADTIDGGDAQTIGWSHSRDDIVQGVEALFSAIKDREDKEKDILEDAWDVIKTAAEVAGEAFEWPIELGAAGAFLPFAAIGAGYMEAADKIKHDRAPSGFATGVALGVMAETPDNIRDYFWEAEPEDNTFFEEGGKIAQYYYDAGLVLGYANGREIRQKGLSKPFWADIRSNTTDKFGDPQEDNWGRNEWIDFYVSVESAFTKGHITD